MKRNEGSKFKKQLTLPVIDKHDKSKLADSAIY